VNAAPPLKTKDLGWRRSTSVSLARDMQIVRTLRDGLKSSILGEYVRLEGIGDTSVGRCPPIGLREEPAAQRGNEGWKQEGCKQENVADMVGSSRAEIRKTYQHVMPSGWKRMGDLQSEAWVRAGLDRLGNRTPKNDNDNDR
jgi:hypothetical protein